MTIAREAPPLVMICGSQSWDDENAIQQLLDGLQPGTVLLLGGAKKGADEIAARRARPMPFDIWTMYADWSLGKRAGPLRNLRMLDAEPDEVHAFWDGKSPGTAHVISQAAKRDMAITVYTARGVVQSPQQRRLEC